MIDKSWILLSGKLKPLDIPGSQVRYTDELAKELILQFTKKGDIILDPFAGFGTSLFVAQKLGRVAYGIEYEKYRCDYIAKNLRLPNKIIQGSSLNLNSYKLPRFDFCMTSPPYMRSFDKENPFSNYSRRGSYKQYLNDIKKIYSQIKKLMKKDAFIVIEISNTFGKGKPMTPLAWDVAKELSKIFFLEREIIYCAKDGEPGQGTNHSYVLVFRNR